MIRLSEALFTLLTTVLLGLVCIAPACPDDDATWQLRTQGPTLLRAGKWDEATAAYAGATLYLHEAVTGLVYSERLAGPPFKDPQQRRDILGFYFRHADLSTCVSGAGSLAALQQWLDDYRDLSLRVATPPPAAVDASHPELLTAVIADLKAYRDLRPRGREALELLRQGVEAVPVIAAYLAHLATDYSYVEQGQTHSPQRVWPEADDVARFGPLTRLNLARFCKGHSYSAPHEIAKQLIEAGWAEAPTDTERAALLLALAEIAATKREPSALAAAERVFHSFPQAPASEQARLLAVEAVLRTEGTPQAVAYLERQRQGDALLPGLGEAQFCVSVAYVKAGDYTNAEAQLLDLRRRCAGTPLESRVLLGLSEVCAQTGRAQKERRYLEQCAKFPLSQWTNRSLMDADSSRSVAQERLARWYEQRQRWRPALAAWQAWKPASWCGTCADGMDAERLLGVARCAGRLGAWDTAALAYWEAGAFVGSLAAATRVVALYEQAGQLPDLRRSMDALDRARRAQREAEHMAPDLARRLWAQRRGSALWVAYHLAARRRAGDVAALVAVTRDGNATTEDTTRPRIYREKIAAEHLGALGAAAVPATVAAIREHTGCVSWFIYSLGCNPAPEALAALNEVAAMANTDNRDYENVLYALSLKGFRGVAAITTLSTSSTPLGRAAARWLAAGHQELPSLPDLSLPTAGGLPRELPSRRDRDS